MVGYNNNFVDDLSNALENIDSNGVNSASMNNNVGLSDLYPSNTSRSQEIENVTDGTLLNNDGNNVNNAGDVMQNTGFLPIFKNQNV